MSGPRAPVPSPPNVGEIESAIRSLGLDRRSGELDQEPAFPWTEFRALGERRLLGLRTPERLGGRGLSMEETGIALFHLAYGSGTTFAKLSLQPEFSGVLGELGEPSLVERYFRPLVRGTMLVGNQVTEPSAGSDAASLETRAEKVAGGYRILGTKSQAAFAIDAHAAIVYARTGPVRRGAPGISAFLVPQDAPGVVRTSGVDLGERWMRRGTVRYVGVEIPTEHRLGEEGGAFAALKGELVRERLLLSAIYLGVGYASLDEVVVHAGERHAFGRPLSDRQAVAFPLVEDWARLDAAWLYAHRTLTRADRGEPVEAESGLAKWLATETALAAIDHAIQFSGGRGYSHELRHEQRWRDVRSGALAHGPSEIMHVVAARALWPRRSPT